MMNDYIPLYTISLNYIPSVSMLSSIHLSGNVSLFSTKSDFANTAEDIMYRNFIS